MNAPIRPNLLFVFADQWRGMDLGGAGHPELRTPHLDRLAAEGTRLTRAYATTPVCCPNRACLLTGTYPTTNRVIANDLPLPPGWPTLGTVARDHGYRSGYVGKWHLDGAPRSKFTPPGERRFGFDDFWAAYNCTHDYLHPKFYRDTPKLIEVPGYEPVVHTDLALEFLETHDERPFCLVLSWGPPHDPYEWVPDEYRRFDPGTLELRGNAVLDADNAMVRYMNCRQATADYYAQIEALDAQFGRLLAALDDSGLTENTLVVFTSDHGDMLWSHGLLKKQVPFEEAVNVPFIARLPGRLEGGRTSETLLGTVDLLPTLCGWLGWEVPPTAEGLDLSAAIAGHADGPEHVFLGSHCALEEAEWQFLPEWRAVRTRGFLYAEVPGRVPWLLFDTERDPLQRRNLIGDLAYRAEQTELTRLLGDRLARAGDPFLTCSEMLHHYELDAAWAEREARKDW